ncbi:hypothetical protein HMPREF3038_00555 [Akkermansia sp. KLE1797]|nr:hypothetical protein HMPREF3038_00555 [Akkermansia sp. KLE1797]KXU55391.1 hypothetical protein HMPREF3039_00498 [Akkermansia sp. KLE1798]KZA05830.1 hypothetical protein HMPREF1326_00409 [Akkermansia sp. KLE1605]
MRKSYLNQSNIFLPGNESLPPARDTWFPRRKKRFVFNKIDIKASSTAYLCE